LKINPIAAKSPFFIEPVQALPVEKLPDGDWLYEVKLDGYRALAFKDGKEVRPVSRNQNRLIIPGVLPKVLL
jgi:bifunctional non-homologous end joining protein LigD